MERVLSPTFAGRNRVTSRMDGSRTRLCTAAVAAAVLVFVGFGGTSSAITNQAKAKPKSSFAGYGVLAAVNSVTATVQLPTFSCTSRNRGVDTLTYTNNLVDNLSSAVSGVVMQCIRPKKQPAMATYFVETFVPDPATNSFPILVRGGDVVTMTVTCGILDTVASVEDDTTHFTQTSSTPTVISCSQAHVGDVGVPKGHGYDHLFDFGQLDYSAVDVNGSPIGASNPVASNYFEGKRDVITTGTPTAGGTSFTTTQS